MECAVCFEPYNGPKKLPRVLLCGHTFCAQCVEQMYQNGLIQCPVCRYDMCFPESYNGEQASKALVVNLALLSALKVPFLEDCCETPDQNTQNELYRLNFTDREARLRRLNANLRFNPRRGRLRILVERSALIAMICLFAVTILACPVMLVNLLISMVQGDELLVDLTGISICQLIVYLGYIAEIVVLICAALKDSDSILNIGAIGFVIFTYFAETHN